MGGWPFYMGLRVSRRRRPARPKVRHDLSCGSQGVGAVALEKGESFVDGVAAFASAAKISTILKIDRDFSCLILKKLVNYDNILIVQFQ